MYVRFCEIYAILPLNKGIFIIDKKMRGGTKFDY